MSQMESLQELMSDISTNDKQSCFVSIMVVTILYSVNVLNLPLQKQLLCEPQIFSAKLSYYAFRRLI